MINKLLKKILLFLAIFSLYYYVPEPLTYGAITPTPTTKITSTPIPTISITPSSTPTKSPTSTPSSTITPTNTPVIKSYSINSFFDKPNVTLGDTFTYTISVSNTGSGNIDNLEIRVPFGSKISDTSIDVRNPSYNRLLDSIEYPAGFNSKSWIINSLAPGITKTFTITYKVSNSVITNSLTSRFTLPITWVDPAGLSSNVEHELDYIRADIYLNRVYDKSISAILPNLSTAQNDVSKVILNSKYFFNGSKTTVLSNVDKNVLSIFPEFVLDTQDVTIQWLDTVDLSGDDVAQKLSMLDQYLTMDRNRVIFKKAELPFLNKKVKIIFKNFVYTTDPEIKINNTISSFKNSGFIYSNSSKELTYTGVLDSDISIVPVVIFENNVIETDKREVTITGVCSDPQAEIQIKTPDEPPFIVSSIDSKTGKFEFNTKVSNNSSDILVKVKTSYSPDIEKALIVKYIGSTDQVDAKPVDTPGKLNLSWNQVTIALLLVAIAILSIIGGYIYILIYRKIKLKKSARISSLEPIIENLTTVGSKIESAENKDITKDYLKKEEPVKKTN